MKKTLLLTTVLLLGATVAHAENRSGQNCSGNYCNQPVNQNIQQSWQTQNVTNTNTNRSNSQSNARSNATGGSSGVSNNVNIQGDRTVVAPGLPGMASGPCTGVGGGISLGVVGFGGGISGTAMDDRCTARETARLLVQVGLTAQAQEVMLREYERVMGLPPGTTTNALVLAPTRTSPPAPSSNYSTGGN